MDNENQNHVELEKYDTQPKSQVEHEDEILI